MSVSEIKKDIHWVGAIDWNMRDFHGYNVDKGSTYNAFLVMDEKVTLFDTVKAPFRNDLLHNIRKIIAPGKIDYLVVNHVEPDHSGALPALIDTIKPEKIFCSAMGKKGLIEHFHQENWPIEVVADGQEVSIGKRSIKFIETRMLHWPDSMFSYIPQDKLLISSDAFGQHWATSERFDDQVDMAELMGHAGKYYANILMLYSSLVQKVLKKVTDLGIAIDMIAPDHGLIWRSHVKDIIKAYNDWSAGKLKRKAVIVYDTMWHSTEKMAKALAEGLIESGISVRLMQAKHCHRSEVMTEVLDASAVLFGSSTLNNNLLPSMADILTYMKGLKPSGRIGAAFGSYGWSGEAVKQITEYMTAMNLEIVGDGLRQKNVPAHDDLKLCVQLGRDVAKAINAKIPV